MTLNMIYVIAVIEGIVSLGIEVSGFRQITPFLGSSLEITTLILSSFFIALSIGYFIGSQYVGDKEAILKRLMLNFTLISISSGLILSYLLMYEWFSLSWSLYILFFGWLVAFAIPVALLGQTLPLLASLTSFESHNKASGRVLFASTLGSVVGAIGVSAFLFNLIGVSYTIVLISLIAFLVVLLILQQLEDRSILALGAVGLFIVLLANGLTNLLSQNAYANVDVAYDQNRTRYFRINGNLSTHLTDDNLTSDYINRVRLSLEAYVAPGANILVLGAGGFGLSYHYNRYNVTYVDINPDLQHVAERYFLGEPINGTFIAEDARSFVLRTTNRYDAILIDTFRSNTAAIPHLATKEFFDSIERIKSEHAIVLVNMVVDPFFRDDYSKSFRDTVQYGLGDCAFHASGTLKILDNVLAICQNRHEIYHYSDDLNRLSLYLAKSKLNNRLPSKMNHFQ